MPRVGRSTGRIVAGLVLIVAGCLAPGRSAVARNCHASDRPALSYDLPTDRPAPPVADGVAADLIAALRPPPCPADRPSPTLRIAPAPALLTVVAVIAPDPGTARIVVPGPVGRPTDPADVPVRPPRA